MEYRREIDGLRAVAVLPVILFHAGFRAFEGGFVGVDVFFVISGYLITSIILADMQRGTFSIATFYERRARRILPALFGVMLCSMPFAWYWLMPNHLMDFSQSITAISFFSSNILFWQEAGYFATAAEFKPMLHTWSLAVEEQYYFFFPLFLMCLWQLRKRWIFGVLLAVATCSLALSQWGAFNKPTATYFLLPTRIWELALGAMIAFFFLYRRKQSEVIVSNRTLCEVLSGLGLLLIGYAVYGFDKSTPFPSVYALLPTVGTGLIIIFSSPETFVGRFLSTKPMVGIGLISYSTYLWHQPLFAFARHRSLTEPNTVLLLGLSIMSLVLAYFTWRYIEMPFRNRNVITRKMVFNFALIGSLVFATVGVAGQITHGFENRKTSSGVLLKDFPNKLAINHGLDEECGDKFTLSAHCRTSDAPEILVWGDSFAMHLVQGILAANPDAKIIQMTKSVCGPFFDVSPVNAKYPVSWARGCVDFTHQVKAWVHANKTVKYAVLSSPFHQYLGNDQLLIDNKLHKANVELATKQFRNTLDELAAMGVKPIVFSPPPTNGENIGECLVKAEVYGDDFKKCNFSVKSISPEYRATKKFLEEISKEHMVIFLDKEICNDETCKVSLGSTYLYRDVGHLSQAGSAALGRNMNFYKLIIGTPSTERKPASIKPVAP